MLQIFYGLIPFIFITVLGFIFGRIRIFDLRDAKVLNLFLFYIAVPALIIKFVAQSEIGQIDIKQITSYLLMQGSLGLITFLIMSKTSCIVILIYLKELCCKICILNQEIIS